MVLVRNYITFLSSESVVNQYSAEQCHSKYENINIKTKTDSKLLHNIHTTKVSEIYIKGKKKKGKNYHKKNVTNYKIIFFILGVTKKK